MQRMNENIQVISVKELKIIREMAVDRQEWRIFCTKINNRKAGEAAKSDDYMQADGFKSNGTMEQWKAVLTHVFGGKSRKRWKTVAFDIMSVDIGIKPAYLCDQWSCSKEEARSLLANLQKQQLVHNKLGILSVELDILIFSVKAFQFPILPTAPLIVDVSVSLEQPLIVDKVVGQYFATCDAFQNFCQFLLQKKENDSLTSDSIPEFEIKVRDAINPPCLFGLALGYPFTYWYNREESDDNCLSMQTLRLYQVKGCERNDRDHINRYCCYSTKSLQNVKSASILHLEVGQFQKATHSFSAQDSLEQKHISSFPSAMNKNESYEIQNHAKHQVKPSCENRSNSQSDMCSKDCSDGHVIFSFTVPESCHTQTARDHAESWFSAWRLSVPWCSLFSDVWMEEALVQPRAVCL